MVHTWRGRKGNGGEGEPCLCFLHSKVRIVVNVVISLWYSTLETCLQELCPSPPSAEENGDQFHSPPQKHWCSWGGLWHCHDPCAWASQGCGQLLPTLAGVGCALLPSARRGSSQTLRPCPGVRDPAHLPPADCPQAGRPVFWEEALAAASQCRERWECRGAALLIWESPSGQNEVVIGKRKCKKWTFQAVASMTPRKMLVCVFHLIYLSWGKGKNIIYKLMALLACVHLYPKMTSPHRHMCTTFNHSGATLTSCCMYMYTANCWSVFVRRTPASMWLWDYMWANVFTVCVCTGARAEEKDLFLN